MAGVAILGSIVNGQLTVNLTARLVAIGIPESFRSQVIAAVTTGSLGSQAAATKVGKGNASIQEIINKVVSAAYGAFGHGLDLSLLAAGALLMASAVVAYFTASRSAPGPAESSAARRWSQKRCPAQEAVGTDGGLPWSADRPSGRWARTNSPTAR